FVSSTGCYNETAKGASKMFIFKSKEQIQKAIERARANHTFVKLVRFGEYMVKGSAGNFYTVRCEKRGSVKVVDCSCVAGTFGFECYHAASALSLHVGLAARRSH
ncbi:MAG TPA: hypothetical protein VE821_14435, partial [Pyrinomonadaceae bacterium]|nr:hypothetical protein [Pyrinomonadaceae bacterium]